MDQTQYWTVKVDPSVSKFYILKILQIPLCNAFKSSNYCRTFLACNMHVYFLFCYYGALKTCNTGFKLEIATLHILFGTPHHIFFVKEKCVFGGAVVTQTSFISFLITPFFFFDLSPSWIFYFHFFKHVHEVPMKQLLQFLVQISNSINFIL